MDKIKIHKERKIFKRGDNAQKLLSMLYKPFIYAMVGYALIFQYDFDLFANITILFGINEYFLKKI